MNKKYSLYYLSQEFYKKYDKISYPEIENKETRPYMVLLIKIENNTFAIPFRTNIKHKYCYKFKHTSRGTKSSTGLDYTKAVIVNDIRYIGTPATIDNKEYVELNNKYFFIIKQFKNYINKYIDAVKMNQINFDDNKYKYSTLKYFHSELGLEIKLCNEKPFTISRSQIRANADRVKSDERSSVRRDKHHNRGNDIG